MDTDLRGFFRQDSGLFCRAGVLESFGGHRLEHRCRKTLRLFGLAKQSIKNIQHPTRNDEVKGGKLAGQTAALQEEN